MTKLTFIVDLKEIVPAEVEEEMAVNVTCDLGILFSEYPNAVIISG